MPWLSITEYAKKRGVSRQWISKLIHSGWLKSATRQKGNRQQIDSDKADKILAANIDPSWSDQAKLGKTEKRSTKTDSTQEDFLAAKLRAQIARADIETMKAKAMRGEYVKRADVEKGTFDCGRALRDLMLTISERIAAFLAAEENPMKVSQVLTKEIRQGLEELTRWKMNDDGNR